MPGVLSSLPRLVSDCLVVSSSSQDWSVGEIVYSVPCWPVSLTSTDRGKGRGSF